MNWNISFLIHWNEYIHILNSITKFTAFDLFYNALERPIPFV